MSTEELERTYWQCLGLIDQYKDLTPFGMAVIGFGIRERIQVLLDRVKNIPDIYWWLNVRLQS